MQVRINEAAIGDFYPHDRPTTSVGDGKSKATTLLLFHASRHRQHGELFIEDTFESLRAEVGNTVVCSWCGNFHKYLHSTESYPSGFDMYGAPDVLNEADET